MEVSVLDTYKNKRNVSFDIHTHNNAHKYVLPIGLQHEVIKEIATAMNTLTVPTISVQDPSESSMQSIYLEVPMLTRRRRSFQVAPQLAPAQTGSSSHHPLLPGGETAVEGEEEIFNSPRLFTELMVYSEYEGSDSAWKEAARWVRFEEDVEEGGERWSKPRVSSLSVHSFFDTRSMIIKSNVLLNIVGSNLDEILEDALTKASSKEKLQAKQITKIKNVLKSKAIHLYEMAKNNGARSRPLSIFKRKSSEEKKVEENMEEGSDYKGNKHFFKKLPEGAEAANVMVGEVKCLDKALCLFIRLKEPVSLGSLTEVPIPTRFMFILIGPLGELVNYCEIGRAIGALFSDEVFREVAYEAKETSHILAGIDEFLDAATLLPPGEWDPLIRIEPPDTAPTKETRKKNSYAEQDDPEDERKLLEESGLTRSGRFFGGLVNDIKRKKPFYLSDFTDGFSLQTIATFFFLYFACLTPIVTFGGLLGEATGNNIAVMESLLAALICGVVYGLLSGQPLTILGSTGPVLVFENIMYDFCVQLDWNYLSFRLWVGLWAALILIILVAIDASVLVCYITRFTEENFATLIAFIFIFKAIEKVVSIGTYYPMHTHIAAGDPCSCVFENDWNETVFTSMEDCVQANGTLIGDDCKTYYPDIFLFSIILFLGTFIISMQLKHFKTASFFPAKVRSYISAFAVIIAILVMTSIDKMVGINTPKLYVPSEIKPTSPSRGWLIHPFNGNPWFSVLVAPIPAVLACILIFMDQQITAVIINRKEHKLKKGCGYHLDLFILAILLAVNSVMGLPWFVAATVLSINHVNSLFIESECSAPGEQPQFLGVRENRVTHVLIFLFIGMSVFLAPVLKWIPMPVLFGVFLYMGISALNGIQLFERILIMFMPLKYQPDRAFLRQVRLNRVHLFTGIQMACLAILWTIKSFAETSILFPLMLVVMIGVRKALDLVFTQRELKILDDVLPEFSRKEKMGVDDEDLEVSNHEEEHRQMYRKDRSHSIFLAAGGVINLNDDAESRKQSMSENGSQSYLSAAVSRKGSVTSNRSLRRGSILEPIFGTNHHYQAGNPLLTVPKKSDALQYIDADTKM